MPLARLFRNSPRWTILVILAVVFLAAGLLAIRPGSRSRRVISHFACNFVCTKCNAFEPIDFDIEFFGLRYRGRTDNLIDRQILQFGAFEKPMLYFSRDVAAALGSDGSYVDVGANVGQYSLFMSKYVRRVHSFEPYPPVLERFRDLVALNGISNVEIHPVGLGDQPAELPFFAPPGENLGVGSFVENFGPDNSDAGGLKLTIRVGDDELGNLEGETIVLIKIDIEGFEKPALHGLARTLTAHRPVVMLELNIDPRSEISFHREEEFVQAFPPDYRFLAFDPERGDLARGIYQTIEFVPDFTRSNQSNVVALPAELSDRIPRSNRDTSGASIAMNHP